MALKIRLSRGGAKKRPYYRIVVADARCPRDGRFIEKVGTYNPLLQHGDENRIVLNRDRITHWMANGALPTDRVQLFLADAGIVEKKARTALTKKAQPKKKAQERMAAEAAAADKEAEAAAEPASADA